MPAVVTLCLFRLDGTALPVVSVEILTEGLFSEVRVNQMVN